MFLYGVSAVVLPRRLEEEQVQVELGRVARAERVAQRFVPQLRPRVRLGDARDLVRRLGGPELVERLHERLGAIAVLADEGHPAGTVVVAGRAARVQPHDVERLLEGRRLWRSRLLPEAAAGGAEQDRLAAGAHHDGAPGLGQRQPVLEMRAGPQGPVLIVVLAAHRGFARLDDDGVPALRLEHAGKAALEIGDVLQVEGV